MNQKSQRGFTLIELLVVIAIIGILASVVVASLNSARTRGNDAAIKANLANIRSQAELYYDSNGNQYLDSDTPVTDTACTAGIYSDTTVQNAITAAISASPDDAAACHASRVAWASSVQLNSADTEFWCVDSTGASKLVATGTTAGDPNSAITDIACE